MSIWYAAVLTAILFDTQTLSTDSHIRNNTTGEEHFTKPKLLQQISQSSKIVLSMASVPRLNVTRDDQTFGVERYPHTTNSSATKVLEPKSTEHTAPASNKIYGHVGRDKPRRVGDNHNVSADSRPRLHREFSNLTERNSMNQTKHNNDMSDTLDPVRSFASTAFNIAENPHEIQTCNFTLAELGDFCTGPSWTCRDRCGENSFVKGQTGPATCHCGHRCLVYASCCEDFQRECPTEHEKAVKETEQFEGNTALCEILLMSKVFSFCPLDYPSSKTKLQCESGYFWNSIEGIFPVTDSLSGHHFRNKACWECWQWRGLNVGEPLAWKVSCNLPLSLHPSLHYDLQIFLDGFNDEPEKCMWRAPEGYMSFYCHTTPPVCTGCSGGGIEEKCQNSPEGSVQVDKVLYHQRYCYFCSERFVRMWNAQGNNVLSLLENGCEPPSLGMELDPVYNMFEFTVVFSLRGLDMDVMLLEDNNNGDSYSWSALICNDGDTSCNATGCINGIQPQDGRCKQNLVLSTMWAYICFGVSASHEAIARSDCTQNKSKEVSTEMMVETVWPWVQGCLEAGRVDRNFQVTSVNVVKRSPLFEFHIQFVYDFQSSKGYGDIRLRNCALLAITQWLHTMPEVLPRSETDGVIDQWITGNDISAQEDEVKAPYETYICLKVMLGIRTLEGMSMAEGDCFLDLNVAGPDGVDQNVPGDKTRNRCHNLQRPDIVVVNCLMLFLVLLT